MRRFRTLVLAIASLSAFANAKSAFADCRTQNAACVKDAVTPIDSVACGSLYRTCATNQAIAAQQNANQGQANKPAVPVAPAGVARPAHK